MYLLGKLYSDRSSIGLDLLGVSLLVIAVERGHISLEVLLQLIKRSHGLVKRPGSQAGQWRL